MKMQQNALKDRHEIERRFHDAKASSEHASENRNFYMAGGVDLIWRSYLNRVGDLQGKKVLDFGCGEGWSTLEYARRGAFVYSFDISKESVRKLIQEIRTPDLSKRIYPAVMAGEYLSYSSNSFDLVLGVSVLHHTDLKYVGNEVARALKPGGRALFIEPLIHNRFIQAFRWLTPQRRTPTERPLSVQQIRDFGRSFRSVTFQGYYLLSTLPQGFLWATGKRQVFRQILPITEFIDHRLLKTFPFLHRYCWSSIIEVEK